MKVYLPKATRILGTKYPAGVHELPKHLENHWYVDSLMKRDAIQEYHGPKKAQALIKSSAPVVETPMDAPVKASVEKKVEQKKGPSPAQKAAAAAQKVAAAKKAAAVQKQTDGAGAQQ